MSSKPECGSPGHTRWKQQKKTKHCREKETTKPKIEVFQPIPPLSFRSAISFFQLIALADWHLREHWGINGSLDDAGVDGQDGQNDAGQKNQGQLVDILDTDKHHRGHRGQQDGPVHAHVVQQSGLRLGPLQALQRKDGRFGHNVDLKGETLQDVICLHS